MRFRASDVATATGGRLVGPDVEIDGVSFDSRSLQAGQLFVPIVADRDGHRFIDAAVGNGASAYLTAHEVVTEGCTAIEVRDTLRALMELASAERAKFEGTVVGITGSVGKTSTKDLLWAAMAPSQRTWANERSFNNDQGLPTTILNMPLDTEVLVLEMGMRGFGEIERLCRVARPHIGVVTRVAEAHSDRVGGIAGVARAKAELVVALPSDGVAILNADDPMVRAMEEATEAEVVRYGSVHDAHVRVHDMWLDELARPRFRLESPWGSVLVRLGVSGAHMGSNAAAALACVGVVGGDLEAAAAELADVGLSAMRMEVVTTPEGAIVLNDCYNANPTSMRAALDALAALPATRRVAVLGVMAEIADSDHEHRAIVRYANERDIDVLAVGTELYGTVPVVDPIAALGSVGRGDVVLVKGSRVAGLERVAAALVGD